MIFGGMIYFSPFICCWDYAQLPVTFLYSSKIDGEECTNQKIGNGQEKAYYALN
jgi:hypothetical protein